MRSTLLIIIALVSALLTGCLEGGNSSGGGNAAPTQTKGPVDPVGAEQLAQAGERWVNPVTFPKAFALFQKALQKDPNNLRAGFYQAVLAPAMHTQGLLARVRPYVKTLDNGALARLDGIISRIQQPNLFTFLTSGPNDFLTEADVQNFTQLSLVNDFAAARQFFKTHKNQVLELTNNFYSESNSPSCGVVTGSDGALTLQDCGMMTVKFARLTQPDFEVLQQLEAGAEIYAIGATAYDLTGSNHLAEYGDGRQLTNEDIINFARQETQLGQLRPGQRLGEILGMGSDAVAAVAWAKSMQNQFCPGGVAVQRPGDILPGPCIPDAIEDGTSVDHLLRIASLALQGTTVTVNLALADGSRIDTDVTNQPLSNPVADLKMLLPDQFDRCGRPVSFADPTLGGLFPDGDGNRLLVYERNSCWE